MRILVSGASGYLGKHLLQSLDREWIPVARKVLKPGNLPSWEIQSPIPEANVAIHLAGLAHETKKTSEEDIYWQANVHNTETFLTFSYNFGVRHFIFVSTLKVYGEEQKEPISADTPLNPSDIYSRTKVAAEELIQKFCAERKIDYTILRPPILYGPNPKANIGSLVSWVYRGFPVPVSRSVNLRSFLSLDNFSDLIREILINPKAKNQIFLPSDPLPLSTEEFIYWIGQGLGTRARVLKIPETLGEWGFRAMGMQRFWMRLSGNFYIKDSGLEKTLGWIPPVPSEKSIREMAIHFLRSKNEHQLDKIGTDS